MTTSEPLSLEWFQNYVAQVRKAHTEEGVLVVLGIMVGEVTRATERRVFETLRQTRVAQ